MVSPLVEKSAVWTANMGWKWVTGRLAKWAEADKFFMNLETALRQMAEFTKDDQLRDWDFANDPQMIEAKDVIVKATYSELPSAAFKQSLDFLMKKIGPLFHQPIKPESVGNSIDIHYAIVGIPKEKIVGLLEAVTHEKDRYGLLGVRG